MTIKNESIFQGVVEAQGFRAVRTGGAVRVGTVYHWELYKRNHQNAYVRIGAITAKESLTPGHMLAEARYFDAFDQNDAAAFDQNDADALLPHLK